MKHDTSSIILYVCLAISALSIWPLLSPDTQIPFLRPEAVLVGTITLLLFLRGIGWRWWAITAQHSLSASNCDRIFNNWPYPHCWPNCRSCKVGNLEVISWLIEWLRLEYVHRNTHTLGLLNNYIGRQGLVWLQTAGNAYGKLSVCH